MWKYWLLPFFGALCTEQQWLTPRVSEGSQRKVLIVDLHLNWKTPAFSFSLLIFTFWVRNDSACAIVTLINTFCLPQICLIAFLVQTTPKSFANEHRHTLIWHGGFTCGTLSRFRRGKPPSSSLRVQEPPGAEVRPSRREFSILSILSTLHPARAGRGTQLRSRASRFWGKMKAGNISSLSTLGFCSHIVTAHLELCQSSRSCKYSTSSLHTSRSLWDRCNTRQLLLIFGTKYAV